jgi:hypothetical protein
MNREAVAKYIQNIAQSLSGIRKEVGMATEAYPRRDSLPSPAYSPVRAMRPMRNPLGHVVVHWTGKPNRTNSVASIQKMWRYHTGSKRQYADIGYHEAWDQDGEWYWLRDGTKMGSHTKGNNHAFGWVFLGDKPHMEALKLRWLRHSSMYPWATIRVHRDFRNTQCPGEALTKAVWELE